MCLAKEELNPKVFSINWNIQHVNGMTPFDLAAHYVFWGGQFCCRESTAKTSLKGFRYYPLLPRNIAWDRREVQRQFCRNMICSNKYNSTYRPNGWRGSCLGGRPPQNWPNALRVMNNFKYGNEQPDSKKWCYYAKYLLTWVDSSNFR